VPECEQVVRVGRPEEVAHVIAFLFHDLAGFVTGQTIHIDGGLTISAVK
jgi:3-oxoacyl-[acyl-carrier protein] reductase